MDWRTLNVVAELGPLSVYLSNYGGDGAHWNVSAHLIVGEGDAEIRACVVRIGGYHDSLAEAQAAAHAWVEQLGPVQPWLVLFAFFRFDRDRPTARRLATARTTLRKARRRKAA
jgi:hypothetical protein